MQDEAARWAIEAWMFALFAPRAMVDPTHDPQTFVVAHDGRGNFESINAALLNSPPKSRLLICEGVYDEALVITKPIEIVGISTPEKVVIRNTKDPCISMQADHGTVRNVTLASQAWTNHQRRVAADIPRGYLLFDNCHLTSDSLACVSVHGSHGSVILKECRIHDSNQSGVFAWRGGTAFLENCSILRNDRAGVAAVDHGYVTVRECHFYDGRHNGVFIANGAGGAVEHCEIIRHEFPGVSMHRNEDSLVVGCVIKENRSGGLRITSNAKAVIRNCEISENSSSGVYVSESDSVMVADCRISGNKGSGVVLENAARVRIQNSDVSGNLRGDWAIGDNCNLLKT